MSDIINLLPDSVANQIAAGEVVQNPASVVKELMENSIDAGATLIKLIVKKAGDTLIQVIDNGKGMSMTDARMSFERHATSKIKSVEDLFSLHTMGFRGEALASIASVAQVEMRTRREEDELGTYLEIAGSKVIKQEPIQTDKGTNIAVKKLFFNVPARRKFLKSRTTMMRNIRNEFYRIVLVHPEIQFELFEDDNNTLSLEESDIKTRIENVFSRLSKKKIVPIKNENQILNITGFVGRPEFAQKKAQQYFFVNNRYMKHSYFRKAVTLAYENLIKQDENPSYFIYFDINPELIDVNIHPTKTEIKFEDERAIWTILHATVKEVLGKFQIAPSLDFDKEEMPDIPVLRQGTHISQPKTNFNPSYNPFHSTTPKSYSPQKMDFNWDKLYNDFATNNQHKEAQITQFETIASNSEPNTQIQLDITEEKKEFFQLKNTYIITNVKSGLMLIHQHRAHFRVLFDHLIKTSSSSKTSQQVLFPEVIELDSNETEQLLELLPNLENVGFDLQKEAQNSFKINGIPAELEINSAIPLLKEIISATQEIELDTEKVVKEKIVEILAQKGAIKTGKKLTNEEMSKLIEELFSCQNHTYTPNGKTIISMINENEIVRLFS